MTPCVLGSGEARRYGDAARLVAPIAIMKQNTVLQDTMKGHGEGTARCHTASSASKLHPAAPLYPAASRCPRAHTATPVPAASSAAFNARHLLRQDYKCTARVALAAPPGGADDGGWRPTNTSADAEEADEEEAIQAERLTYMRLHGALQFTGWMVGVHVRWYHAVLLFGGGIR